MSQNGSLRQPDLWISLANESSDRAAGLGVKVDQSSDSVTIALPTGDVIHVYGNGQIWREDRCQYFKINDSEIYWR